MQASLIVIVGGGPAGATVAAILARAGREVTLIERRSDAESKCCGWCLAPRAMPTLERVCLKSAVLAAASGSTRRWRLHEPSGAMLLDESLGAGEGLVVDRARLDAALRESARKAGATLIEGAAMVTDDRRVAVRDRGEVRERSKSFGRGAELTPHLVIGADGVGSGVARAFGLAGVPRGDGNHAQAGDAAHRREAAASSARRRRTAPRASPRRFGISWSISTQLGDSIGVPQESIEIHLAREGYLGVVRAEDRVLVAALIDRDRTRGSSSPIEVIRRWAQTSAALRPLGTAIPDGASPMHATGPLPWRPARIALARGEHAPFARGTTAPNADSPGVALVGDAAGYEEPFTGEGMAMAFESAELLARHVLACERWDAAAAARYTAEHRARFDCVRRRVRALAGIGSLAARSAPVASLLRVGGRIPFVPGAIVRSVVAA